ncbi:SusC/RagA family TonB-linked outer membrane protein [Pseudopedobacter beijingensis]|uniref:SusC/RagA family TonB-linked outer membrane protein n=1 Tax=Pseudopedobacter beijingensis TaxID=1207056 RepID=A0ABW4IHT7_9SPHI
MNLKNLSKYILILITLIGAIGEGYAQSSITVTGTVTDKEKLPLIGVGIGGKSGRGTQTNVEGKFTLTATEGELLTFSYIGYNTIQLPAKAIMNVVLEENAVMLEAVQVVDVGYGTMRKSDLTGAISSVSAKDLRQGVITSAEQLLQGKVAGLTVVQPSGDPTQGSSLRLRGGTSLSASNSPLIVVDGIPGVDMNTVQPNEILSIDVLKDASAAAIYGSRGANGVIIVTTNRENAGKSMNYNGYVAVGNVAKNLDLLSANQWRAYVRENNISGAIDYGADTNWQEELQRTAVSNSHNISFTNGGKEGGYRASISYLNSEGVIKTSALNRLSGNLSAHQKALNNRLKLEASVFANRDNYNPVDIGIYERAYNLNPTLPVMQNGAYTQIGGTNSNNPVEVLMNRQDDQTRKRLLGFAKAEIDIIEGLKGVVNTSYEYNSQQGRFFWPSYSFNGQTDKGYARRSTGDYTNSQVEAYLTYDKVFDNIHRFNVTGGYSYLINTYEGYGAERRGFDSDLFGYNNLAAGSDFRMGDVYSYKGEAKLISFFGRVNYVLKDKYMLTGTLRRDGSSRFGDNHKWGLFPAVSAAWRISEESFLANSKDWLNNLKLRIGYGITGNQDGIGEYKSLSLMGTGGGAYYDQATDSWKQSYSITQNPNPNLKWESTAQTNVGVDLSIFNRFNLTVDAYIKKTSDLLYTYDVPQPPYLYDKMLANVGDLTNKGIEFTLGASIMKTSDFTWNANLVLAHNKQKIDKLSNDIYQTDAISSGNLHGLTGMTGVYTQIIKEGYPVGTFWGPKFLGFDENGKFLFEKDETGAVINQYLGNVQPKLTTGFAMYFAYKDFDLNVAANGMFGQKILNAQALNISYPGRLPGYNVLDSWLDKGYITEGPIFSDYWIEKGNFLRLQSLTLGYNLPVKNAWFHRIRLYATGENLFVITNYTGIDPEVNISGLKSPGIDKSVGEAKDGDNYYYPRSRTFSFGLNLSF